MLWSMKQNWMSLDLLKPYYECLIKSSYLFTIFKWEVTNYKLENKTSFMLPWPKEENRLKVTVRPFQLPVLFDSLLKWSNIILTYVFCKGLAHCRKYSYFYICYNFIHQLWKSNTQGKSTPRQSICEILYLQLEYVLTNITSQGIQYKTKS